MEMLITESFNHCPTEPEKKETELFNYDLDYQSNRP